MVKRSEIGEAWFQGSGLSVGSETLGPSSRLSRPAPSLQMQSVGATKTATLTVLQYHARAGGKGFPAEHRFSRGNRPRQPAQIPSATVKNTRT